MARSNADRIDNIDEEIQEPEVIDDTDPTETRVIEIMRRRREIDAEAAPFADLAERLRALAAERAQLDTELATITGLTTASIPNGQTERKKRLCGGCGQTGHIVRGHTEDGRPICNTHPNGKPLEA